MIARYAKTRTVFAALLLVAALLFVPANATAKKKRQRGIYWGAWIGKQITGTEAPWDMGAVTHFQEAVGKGLSLLEFSSPFRDCRDGSCDYYRFPRAQMQSIRNYGAIPVFGWNSAEAGEIDEIDPNFQLADVIAGTYDSYISSFAREARDWGQPFFLRFNWEMNGDWFPWGEPANGNSPGESAAAWRHVHDIFSAVGATNATWVWCPYADSKRKLRPIGSLYPGDAYVDWTCLDGFNWTRNGVNPQRWRNFDEIFRRPYLHIVKHIAPRKPLMIAEVATNGSSRVKTKWIRRMFAFVKKRYGRIRAFIWFEKIDRGVQWPVTTFAASRRAFSTGLHRGPFRGNFYAGLAGSPIRPPR